MQATRTTFLGLPDPTRRSWKGQVTGLKREASRAPI